MRELRKISEKSWVNGATPMATIALDSLQLVEWLTVLEDVLVITADLDLLDLDLMAQLTVDQLLDRARDLALPTDRSSSPS